MGWGVGGLPLIHGVASEDTFGVYGVFVVEKENDFKLQQ